MGPGATGARPYFKMSTLITLEDARARGIDLPEDDAVAQDILDEQESWLARKIGPLTGERTETFYAGIYSTSGALGLRRFTDSVEVVDGGSAVDPADVRLVQDGAAVTRTYQVAARFWRGPYITVTYTPNDEADVRRVLFGLTELEVAPVAGEITSETLGSYSYQRAAGFAQPSKAMQRAALASSILPKRAQAQTIYSASRSVTPDDPVINRPEYEPYPI